MGRLSLFTIPVDLAQQNDYIFGLEATPINVIFHIFWMLFAYIFFACGASTIYNYYRQEPLFQTRFFKYFGLVCIIDIALNLVRFFYCYLPLCPYSKKAMSSFDHDNNYTMSVYFIRYLNIYKAYFVYALVFERFNQVANNNWKQFKTLCSCVMLNICILMSILTFFYMKKCDHHLMLDLTITGKTPVITVFYCTDDHVVDTNAKIYAVYLGIMTLITCNLFAFTFKKIFDLKYELSVNDEAIKMENRCTIALIFPVSFQFMETIYIWLFWKVEYLRNDFIVNYQIFTLLTLLATILALQGLSNKVVKTRNRKLGDEEHNVKLTIMEN